MQGGMVNIGGNQTVHGRVTITMGDMTQTIQQGPTALGDKEALQALVDQLRAAIAAAPILAEHKASVERVEPEQKIYQYWLALSQLALGQYEASLVSFRANNEGNALSEAYTAIWCSLVYRLLNNHLQAQQAAQSVQAFLSLIEPLDQQRRVEAMWTLLQGDTATTRRLYGAVLTEHRQTNNSVFSPRFYLQVLATVFRERADVQEMYLWFKAETAIQK